MRALGNGVGGISGAEFWKDSYGVAVKLEAAKSRERLWLPRLPFRGRDRAPTRKLCRELGAADRLRKASDRVADAPQYRTAVESFRAQNGIQPTEREAVVLFSREVAIFPPQLDDYLQKCRRLRGHQPAIVVRRKLNFADVAVDTPIANREGVTDVK